MHLADAVQDALGDAYHIDEELDGGGMSRLFLATERSLGRKVVVKIVSPDADAPTAAARFRREIDLTVRLQHPHILPILAAGAREDLLYYITPYISGESLRRVLDRGEPLTVEAIARILRQTAEALACAHAAEVVHRDVKPGNILLADGNAILADFGIARAIWSSQSSPLTGSGMVPGTPAYMTPELSTTPRDDLYALGMVGCEMLGGRLPRRGVTGAELAQARGVRRGESRRAVRALADVLARAVSLEPEQRFDSAVAFESAVADAVAKRIAPWQIAAGVVALVTVAAASTVGIAAMRNAPALAEDLHVVVVPASVPAPVADRIIDALQEWDGVRVMPMPRVREALGDAATATDGPSHRAMIRAARAVGAGKLVAVQADPRGDSVIVRATLHNVAADSVIAVARAGFGADAGAVLMESRRMVNALLRGDKELPWRSAADNRRASLVAWRAYDAGRMALHRWDLTSADSAFGAAVASEPDHALAHLWLAQTRVWTQRRPLDAAADVETRSVARRAAELAGRLSHREVQQARAVLALVSRDLASACEGFRSIVAADSADLAGWLGLGDCLRSDGLVLSDRRSPSGWRFRSSFQEAARVYARAGDMAPSVTGGRFRGWLLGRMTAVRYASVSSFRQGYAFDGDTTFFGARLFLDADTLAMIPRPLTDMATGRGDPPPAAMNAAVDRNRDVLRRIAEDWVTSAPTHAPAYDSLARLTELVGRPATLGGRPATALEIVRLGQRVAADSVERLSLGIDEVRLLLKEARFAEAHTVADSLLQLNGEQRTPPAALAGLATLLGRSSDAARALVAEAGSSQFRLRSGTVFRPPLPLAEPAMALRVYAALGGPADSLSAIAARIRARAPSYAPGTSQGLEVVGALIGPALSLTFDGRDNGLGDLATGPDEIMDAQRAFLRGDRPAVARQLDIWANRTAAGQLPGAVAIEATYRQVMLTLVMGDTARAIAHLDRVLHALPTLGVYLVAGERPEQAGTLVRSFVLRADLAAHAGDVVAAGASAAAVVALWQDADPTLQPVVDRMRRLLPPRR